MGCMRRISIHFRLLEMKWTTNFPSTTSYIRLTRQRCSQQHNHRWYRRLQRAMGKLKLTCSVFFLRLCFVLFDCSRHTPFCLRLSLKMPLTPIIENNFRAPILTKSTEIHFVSRRLVKAYVNCQRKNTLITFLIKSMKVPRIHFDERASFLFKCLPWK